MVPCAEAPHPVGFYPVGGFIRALPVHSLPTIAQQHGLVSFFARHNINGYTVYMGCRKFHPLPLPPQKNLATSNQLLWLSNYSGYGWVNSELESG